MCQRGYDNFITGSGGKKFFFVPVSKSACGDSRGKEVDMRDTWCNGEPTVNKFIGINSEGTLRIFPHSENMAPVICVRK